jgi:hypothetical protein
MVNIALLLTGQKKDGYQTRQDTAALVQAVVSARSVETLSGEDIWNLTRLTWISRNRKKASTNHWKTLKIPALAGLFRKSPELDSDLPTTINGMCLSRAVSQSASKKTGIVNFRPTWRNSSRQWCQKNRNDLRVILRDATRLAANDQARYDLASHLEQLPLVKSPGDRAHVRPAFLLSPLIACLDPRSRFPILNGREAVTKLLRKLKLSHRDLSTQVQGLIGIVGQFGISDAFSLDVLSEEVIKHVLAVQVSQTNKQRPQKESPLQNYDEAERTAVSKSRTIVYRRRHDKMTNALGRVLQNFVITTISSQAGRCDAFIKGYSGTSRDLLVEVKPDPDQGSLRIAIGQLFDYRRHLPHRAAADLAVLTMSRPHPNYIELLMDLGITALWFQDEQCKNIVGQGKAWSTLAGGIKKNLRGGPRITG